MATRHLSILTLALVGAALMSGCSSILNTAGSDEYGCPGMPKGVVCATPSQVYEATSSTKSKTAAPTSLPGVPSSALAAGGAAGKGAIASNSVAEPVYGGGPMPQPIREPARVMRVWIAPWIDKDDDLHWPSFLYTEIVPRKWTVGKPDFSAMRALATPHRSLTPTPSFVNGAAPKSSASSTSAPASVGSASGDAAAAPGSGLPGPDSMQLN